MMQTCMTHSNSTQCISGTCSSFFRGLMGISSHLYNATANSNSKEESSCNPKNICSCHYLPCQPKGVWILSITEESYMTIEATKILILENIYVTYKTKKTNLVPTHNMQTT